MPTPALILTVTCRYLGVVFLSMPPLKDGHMDPMDAINMALESPGYKVRMGVVTVVESGEGGRVV